MATKSKPRPKKVPKPKAEPTDGDATASESEIVLAERMPPGRDDDIPARRLADLLKMIADTNRIKIVRSLAASSLNVSEIVKRCDCDSQPATSHHLALMRHAGIVEMDRCGKNNVYVLTDLGNKLAGTIAHLAATLGS